MQGIAIVHFADGTAEDTVTVEDAGKNLDFLVDSWRRLSERFVEDGTNPGYAGVADFLSAHGVRIVPVRHITASCP